MVGAATPGTIGGADRFVHGTVRRRLGAAGLYWVPYLILAVLLITISGCAHTALGHAPSRVEAAGSQAPEAGARDAPESPTAGPGSEQAAGSTQAREDATPAATNVDPPPPLGEAQPGGAALIEVARVRTGVQPKSVRVSPDGRWLAVPNFGYSGRKSVYLYDATSLERIGEVAFKGNGVETAYVPESNTALVSNFSRGVVEFIDVEQRALIDEIKVGANPKVIAVDANLATAYVANWSSNDISVIDLKARQSVARLPGGRHPRGMAVDAGRLLYVGAMWDHEILVYDANSRELTRRFPVCRYPRHLVLDLAWDLLFMSCSGDDRIEWYRASTGERVGGANVGDNPRSLSLSPDRRYLAVANFDASTISIVDLQAMLVRTHEVPGSKRIVGLDTGSVDGFRVYATSWGSNELLVFKLQASGQDSP